MKGIQCEVIKKIRREKDWTQVEMATHLRVSQQNIQGMENAGSNLEKQFAIFLKLLPVCAELRFDPAKDPPVNCTTTQQPRSIYANTMCW